MLMMFGNMTESACLDNWFENNVDNENMHSLILADSFLPKNITNKLCKNKFWPSHYIYD